MTFEDAHQALRALFRDERDLMNYAETFICFARLDPAGCAPVIRDVLNAGSTEDSVQAMQATGIALGGVCVVSTQGAHPYLTRVSGMWVPDPPEGTSAHGLAAVRLIAAVLNRDSKFVDLVLAHQAVFGLDGLVQLTVALVELHHQAAARGR